MEKLLTAPTLPGRRGHNTRVVIINEEPSRTKQSFKKDTEIRTIMKRYAKTGVLGDPTRKPMWGDFTDPDKFENNLNLVADVRSSFQKLPSEVRGRFKNDPVELLAFLQDAKNDEEAVKLGLKPETVLPKKPVINHGGEEHPKPAEKPKADEKPSA